MCYFAIFFKMITFHLGGNLISAQDVGKKVKQKDVLRGNETLHLKGMLHTLRELSLHRLHD